MTCFPRWTGCSERCGGRGHDVAEHPRARAGLPGTDVGSTPSSVEIYAFAPGLDLEKIQIELDRRVLTIADERAPSSGTGTVGSGTSGSGDDKSTAHIAERFAGRFRRVVSLPDDIDPSAVDARYRDGVLQISVKRRESPQPRRITVQ